MVTILQLKVTQKVTFWKSDLEALMWQQRNQDVNVQLSFFFSSWQEAGVQEALGKLLTTEQMSSSMKLLTLQGWSLVEHTLVEFGGHIN